LEFFDNMTAFPENFFYYAKQVMVRYGDRIPIWITFSEPNEVVGAAAFTTDYNAYTAQLLANAKVYHWYREELGGTGQISMKFGQRLGVPLDLNNPADIEASIRYQDFTMGIMGNPVYLSEQIPESVLSTTDLDIQTLTNDEVAYIHGTADFFALDAYVVQFAAVPMEVMEVIVACAANSSDSSWPSCATLSFQQSNGWLLGVPSVGSSLISPQHIREQLGWVWNTFQPSSIFIA
jgi:beta-glucosidase/6-phospho-beta-glucosidase/beta-galactosidase